MKKGMMAAGGVLGMAWLAGALSAQGAVKGSERFGYDPTDATAFLQAALDSGLPEIVVDAKDGPWHVRPLKGRSNQTIVFERGAEIRAKRGEFHDKYTPMLLFDHCTNVVIRGEDPRSCGFRMWHDDYMDKAKYQWSEWRHAISLLSCVNVTLEGVGVCESGGDGLYISCSGRGKPPPGELAGCVNVTVRNCVFDRNHRQGISVIGVDGLLVEDTALTGTAGTPPAAGIDFEPNQSCEPLKNIVLRRCHIAGNQGVGVEIAHQNFAAGSEPVSITVEDCYVEGNRHGFTYGNGARDLDVGCNAGTVTVRRCTFVKSSGGAVRISRRLNCSGLVSFEGVAIEGCGTNAPDKADIFLGVWGNTESAPTVYSFRDVTVRRGQDRPAVEWNRRSRPYRGRPNVISGEVRAVTGGKEETLVFDEAWRARTFPFEEVAQPPPLSYVPAPLDAVEVVDKAPGELQPCPMIFMRGKRGRYLTFYVDRPREVRFHFTQTRVGKRDYSAPLPLEIYAYGGSKLLAKRKMPQGAEGGVVTFNAKAAGFYEIYLAPRGNGIALQAADVPVALNVTVGPLELVGPADSAMRKHRGERHRLHFYVPEGKRFECTFSADGGETVGAAVVDPDGGIAWRSDAVDGFARCQPAPRAGLWAIELGKPTEGAYEDHSVAVKGVPGWLFLNKDRYWK